MQKVIMELVDDITGGRAVETVTFALDGQNLEIDLSEDNAARLRERLEEFVCRARLVGGRRPRKRVTPAAAPAASLPTPKPTRRTRSKAPEFSVSESDVRAWAIKQGRDVPLRGRVPKALQAEYAQQTRT